MMIYDTKPDCLGVGHPAVYVYVYVIVLHPR